jgi:ATP-binding cassette subfamily D (ALD) protein 3
MPPFAKFTSESQRLEGEFRAHHRRVLVHSEEIAFFGGDQREREILDQSYTRTANISKAQHFFQLCMGILDNYLVKYGATMVAYSMLIPAVYFGLHGLKGKKTEDVIQYYLTSTQLFVALGNFLVRKY